MGTKFSKFLSLLLCLVMVVGLLPTVAFAEGTLPAPKNLTWDGTKAKWEYTTGTANVDSATMKLYNTRYSDAVIQRGYQRYTDFTGWDVAKYLLPGETYMFEVIVKERDTSNTTSAMSNTFTMSSGTFTPTAVTNLQLGADGVMTWNEVPYATEYAAKLFEYRDSRWFCVDEEKISGDTTTFTSRWLEKNFTPGMKYKAKLEARQGSIIVGTAMFSNEYTHIGTVHTHTADDSEWKKDEFYHWRECACGEEQKIYGTIAAHTFSADGVCTVCGREQFNNPNNIFPQPQNLHWDGMTAKWELPDSINLTAAYCTVWNVKDTRPSGYVYTGKCGDSNFLETEIDLSQDLFPGETYYFRIRIQGHKKETNINGASYALSGTFTVPGSFELLTIENLNFGRNGYMTWNNIPNLREYYNHELYRVEEDDSLTLLAKKTTDWGSNYFYWGTSLFEDGKTYIASTVAKLGSRFPISHVAYSNEYTHNGTGTAYAVTFTGGEGATGTPPTMENKPEGATFKLPNNTFTKTGCDFQGWNDGTTTYPAGYIYAMPAHPVTFTAQWSGTAVHTCDPVPVPEKAATCTETGNTAYYECECGKLYTDEAGTTETTLEAVTVAKNPANHAGTKTLEHNETQHWYEWDCCHALDGEKADHTPGDWIIDTPATATTDGSRHKACTVCGVTTETEAIPAAGCTITFDANGGTTDTPTAQTDNTGKLTALPEAARRGYTFKGWYDARSGGNEITADTVFTEDTTLYAQWKYVGGYAAPTYSITTDKTGNGSVTVSPVSAAEGAAVTVTATPDKGYALDTLRVTDKYGRPVRLTGQNGKYTFTMPASHVTVKASFRKAAAADPFVDVNRGMWSYHDILYVYEKGLMQGTGHNAFSPNLTTSRAMIVTILYRLEGQPAVSGTSSFRDAAKNAWYTDAVIWGEQNGIVKGYNNGMFGVNDTITREQLAAILYRYMQCKGMAAVTMSEHLTGFSDHGQVSGYAVRAMNWAVANGLINGAGSKLMPTDGATRAQVAAILHRFCENVLK